MKSFLNTCVMYGAGLNAHGIIKYIGSQNVSGVIDSNPNRIGKEFEGMRIISFDDFLRRNTGEPIVISSYQKTDEIIKILKKHDFKNYLVSPYLQSSVTEIKDISKKILENAGSKRIIFDNTVNMFVPLILDELIKLGKIKKVLGFLKSDNKFVLNYYEQNMIENLSDDLYLVKTTIDCDNKEIYTSESINICNLMYYNPDYKNNSLSKYKDIYKGKRCFVIGNGPSLRMEDLDLLKRRGEICFGSNGIFHAYDKTEWRPNYYVITDFVRYKEVYDVIKNFSGESVFIRRFYNMEGMDYIPGANIYNSPPQKGKFEFSDDITSAVFSGMTVTYNMLQIAAYMGFSKIYLLGVDFSFDTLTSNGTNHFDSKYEKSTKMKDIFYRDENLAAYQSAESFSRMHGFRIFNATRGGKLEVFERVSFDSIFDK